MDCMQYANPEFFKSVIKSFNTASGMDCMQFRCFSHLVYNSCVSIPQAVWIACNMIQKTENIFRKSFNTASGMDCMQLSSKCQQKQDLKFQYRKRYGLHAILSIFEK